MALSRVAKVAAAVGALAAIATTAKGSPGFSPVTKPAGQRELARILGEAKRRGWLPGIDTFLQAVALRESGFNNRAKNTTASEADAAAAGLRGALSRGYFSENPTISDRAAWTFGSGGWFGFLPSTGMAAGGKDGPFSRSNPRLIFDPVASVVMALSNAAAMIEYYGATDWAAVRRGWWSLAAVRDYGEQSQRSRDIRNRLVADLQRCCGMTAAQALDFAHAPARLGSYRSANNAWDALREMEPNA